MHLGLIFPFDNDSAITRKHITLSLIIFLLNVLIFYFDIASLASFVFAMVCFILSLFFNLFLSPHVK